ncbi:AMP-binding protein [Rhodococcus sp. NPDC055024]
MHILMVLAPSLERLSMTLSPSAHLDTFCRDNLPPVEQWPELRFDLPELQYPERLNCATALLDDAVDLYGRDKVCFITDSGQWTYGELLDRANQVARVLTEDLGVTPGNRVVLRGPNNPWFVACWFGVVKVGAVAVATMPMLRSPDLQKIIDLTKPALVLCDHRFLDDVHPAADGLTVVDFGGPESGLANKISGKPTSFANVDTAADDVVLLATTSGTTGVPKATMHFHRDVLAIADTFSRHILQPTSDDIFIGSPPIAFTFGLGGLVVFPMRVGASCVLLERATPDQLIDSAEQFGATVLFTAPTAYRSIVRAGKGESLQRFRRCVSAGEHLPRALAEEVRATLDVKIIDGIGCTELLHVFISASDDDIRPGSTGLPVPGFLVEIHDKDGRQVPDGTPGRLSVKGPTGCRYLADPRQATYVADGWNYTGDTYIRDSDGYYWYQARSDDMIVSSGYNIGAPEVETVLEMHPDVSESAVVGIPDDERGMIVHAAVVLAPGILPGDEKVRELQDFVKQNTAPYKYPRSIVFVDALPRTATGKIQRFRLRETAQTR